MADHTVDPARVYVAGLSAGGAMADIVARAYPELFAAAGVHSGLRSGAAGSAMTALAAMRGGPLGPAPAGAAVPTIVFHGDADATVDAVNGAVVAQAALDADARPHPSPSAVHETQGAAPGGRTYTRRVHPGADGRSQVEHWLVHGAGHAWSGGSAQGSFTDPQGPDASAEMLRFFLAHARAERA